jgi:hypothetical protein
MSVIDRAQLLTEEKLWLPTDNVLTDAHMNSINEFVIANQIPADDNIYFAEASCKGLRAIAFANKSKFQVDTKGIKKEKVGDVELEKFASTGTDPWGDFIKSLVDLCPIIGFNGLKNAGPTSIGMQIVPSDIFRITDEANISDLVELDISCPSIPSTPSALRDDTGDLFL